MIKNYLAHSPKDILEIVQEVGEQADRRKAAAYLVGGIVRDLLLKRKNLDLDIVIEDHAAALARDLARSLKAKITVYEQFGTATLELPHGLRLDLAMARCEHYPHPGALPVVKPGTIRDDLFRRDFTINAMAMVINRACFGQLVDMFGGHRDLKEGKIRVLHDRSFEDDPTRILRALRLEQRFGFAIERRTLRLLKTALRRNMAARVKAPRYFAEFKKMLGEPDPVRCLQRLHQLKGLTFLGLKDGIDFRRLTRIHRQLTESKNSFGAVLAQNRWLIYVLAMVEKTDAQTLEHMLTKFHFTNIEKKSVRAGRNAGILIRKLASARRRRSRIYRVLKPLTDETLLYLRARTTQGIVRAHIERFCTKDRCRKIQISGEDLKRIGFRTGRRIGEVLERVFDLTLDRQIQTKRAQLNAARKLLHAHHQQM